MKNNLKIPSFQCGLLWPLSYKNSNSIAVDLVVGYMIVFSRESAKLYIKHKIGVPSRKKKNQKNINGNKNDLFRFIPNNRNFYQTHYVVLCNRTIIRL